jgi:hypothetical protein
MKEYTIFFKIGMIAFAILFFSESNLYLKLPEGALFIGCMICLALIKYKEQIPVKYETVKTKKLISAEEMYTISKKAKEDKIHYISLEELIKNIKDMAQAGKERYIYTGKIRKEDLQKLLELGYVCTRSIVLGWTEITFNKN